MLAPTMASELTQKRIPLAITALKHSTIIGRKFDLHLKVRGDRLNFQLKLGLPARITIPTQNTKFLAYLGYLRPT